MSPLLYLLSYLRKAGWDSTTSVVVVCVESSVYEGSSCCWVIGKHTTTAVARFARAPAESESAMLLLHQTAKDTLATS